MSVILDQELILLFTIVVFSIIDNVSVNVELLDPSYLSVIVLNSQDVRGNRLAGSFSLLLLHGSSSYSLCLFRENEEYSLIKAKYPAKNTVVTCQLVNEQAEVSQGSFTCNNSSITVILWWSTFLYEYGVYFEGRDFKISVSRGRIIFRQKLFLL